MLNRLFIKQSMTGDINLFPGLSYILLTALHPAFISLSSLLLANTTLIIALSYLFDILKKDRQEETRFMVGWWFAVTGLIYTPYLILFLFGLISMSMLKTLKLKDIFQYVTGYLSPFLISWLVQIILQKDLYPGVLHSLQEFGIPEFRFINQISDIVTISIMGLLLIFSLLGYSQLIARKNIHAQKKQLIPFFPSFFFLC